MKNTRTRFAMALCLLASAGMAAAQTPAPAQAEGQVRTGAQAKAQKPFAAPLALRAGAGKADITPAESDLRPGDVIRDHIYARAIVVHNGKTCAVLVSLDQGGVDAAVFAEATQRAGKLTGCPAENFIISATHTHSSNTHGIPPTGQPDARHVADGIVAAVEQASKGLRPARIGFGTTKVYFNTNRDVFDGKTWYQGTNRDGPSDKTLSVVEFLGEDGVPIAVYMNYAMHAINFYLSGQISADYPGEASRYIERRYPGAVALFTQGASGDQNPLLIRPMLELSGIRTNMPEAKDKSIRARDQWVVSAGLKNAFEYQNGYVAQPLPEADRAAYDAALAEVSDVVKASGVIIAESAIDVMRNLTPKTWDAGEIAGASEGFTCPGRIRLDNTARQGELPPYKDGPDAELTVGMLRIAGVHLGWVNGEIYSQIGTRLTREFPSNKFLLATLANKRGTSGYVGSNEAGSHLTFQVIGARIKPGCAEDKIVNTGVKLYDKIGG